VSLSWDDVGQELKRLTVSRELDFSLETVGNASEFVAFALGCLTPPVSVGLGYRPTFIMDWGKRSIQIEISDDRYEFYQFFDGSADIREFPHRIGEPFPQDLAVHLKRMLSN
jgi:hypothetical protein